MSLRLEFVCNLHRWHFVRLDPVRNRSRATLEASAKVPHSISIVLYYKAQQGLQSIFIQETTEGLIKLLVKQKRSLHKYGNVPLASGNGAEGVEASGDS